MTTIDGNVLTESLFLADALRVGRQSMLEPQELPGRYGRVVQSIDQLLHATQCDSVVAGGWAVWRHGYVGRVTQDIDIVLPLSGIEEFLQAAAMIEFQVLTPIPGRWPKMMHKETGVQVDILPEGERPGRAPDFAPTTIPSPIILGAGGALLRYVNLPGLIELKIAAGRLKDRADVAELIKTNRDQLAIVRAHLQTVHERYACDFDVLVQESARDDLQR